MANHCWNWASINGSQESLDLLEKRIEEALSGGEANSLWAKTYPILFGKTDVPLSLYDDYGSKWFDIEFDRHGERDATISGDSAWSPVSPLILKLSKEYNLHIELEYEEPGCDFGGFYECKNGEVLRDETYSYLKYRFKCGNYEGAIDDIKDNILNDNYDTYEGLCTDIQDCLEDIRMEDMEEFKQLINKVNQ
jgi:hypothetical protein